VGKKNAIALTGYQFSSKNVESLTGYWFDRFSVEGATCSKSYRKWDSDGKS